MKTKLFLLLLIGILFFSGCASKITSNNTNNSQEVNTTPKATIALEPETTPTSTSEPTATPTPSPSPTPEPTATPTPSPSPTPEPTATPTPSPSPTPEPTATPTPSPTPEPTATPTPSPSPTPEPTVAISLADKYVKNGTITINVKRDKDTFVLNYSNRKAYKEITNLKKYVKITPNFSLPRFNWSADEYYVGVVEFDSSMTEREYRNVKAILYQNIEKILFDKYPQYADKWIYAWDVFSALPCTYNDIMECKDTYRYVEAISIMIHDGTPSEPGTAFTPVVEQFKIYYSLDFVYTESNSN